MIFKLTKKLRVGDAVKIISGYYKGKIGTILCINTKKNKAHIDGISSRIKELKKKPNESARQIDLKTFIDLSNIMAWDKTSNTTSRIGFKFLNEKKVRYFKKSGLILESK